MRPFGYLFTLHEQRFLSGMAFSICEVIRVATNCTLLTRQATDLANAESHISGAPNENIVQNHLNIVLLNVF